MVKNEYFTYEQNNYGFVLPIDYSVDKLHKEWGEDPRALKKRLLQHSLLQETLYSLVAADGSEKEEPGRKNGKTPLPIEAEPFLKCFFDLASESDYKPLFDKVDKPKLKGKFSSQLCQNLAQKILPQESGDDSETSAFCRRILFQNEGFDAVVMKQQWEDQINERLKLIRKLSKTAPVEIQAQALQDCLMVLDRIALDLSHSQKTSNPKQPPAPKKLLTALLSKRHKINQKRRGYTAYRIKNISIPSNQTDNASAQTLQEAFSLLSVSKTRDADLLNQNNQTTTSDFPRYLHLAVSHMNSFN